jgi:hypothetical protein
MWMAVERLQQNCESAQKRVPLSSKEFCFLFWLLVFGEVPRFVGYLCRLAYHFRRL